MFFFKGMGRFFIAVVAAKPSKWFACLCFFLSVCVMFFEHISVERCGVIKKKKYREHTVWGILVAENAKKLTFFILSIRGGTPPSNASMGIEIQI